MPHRFPFWFALVGFAAVGFVLPAKTSGYSPSDPIVQEMVAKGISYLESLSGAQAQQGYSAVGTSMLTAYAHHKVSGDPSNVVVRRGIDSAIKFLRELETTEVPFGHSKAIYELAVAALLLAEVDPIAYKPQLEQVQRVLFEEQFSGGGWGYKGEKNGDVSQTQYALLAVWTLDHVGIPLDYERVKQAAAWLLRVQDVRGGWPYHGVDPGVGNPLTFQQLVSMSMALAGGSSVLIAGDALRAWGETKSAGASGIEGLPKALKLFRESDANARRPSIAKEPILRAINLCEQYRNQNPYQRRGRDWYHYQIYTLERYESFREIAAGELEKNPAWYDVVVEELRADQNPANGAFGQTMASNTSTPVSTAFAILFLIRSTQKSIATLSTGTLAGGRELPSDTTDIRVDGTQIKGRPVAEAVTDLLHLLEGDGANDLDGQSIPEDLKLASDPVERKAQLDRLERLVRGSESWQARRVAARVLGSSDEVRVVPALIFALSDPDIYVRRYARDGLRFISRKFDGFGMPDKPTYDELRKAQSAWRDWYRTIDPAYIFLDDF